MRILYLVSAFPRRPGDVITPWLVETISRLRSRGVEVEVLAPAYRGSASGRVDGVVVHRYRYAPRGWETLTHDQTAPDRIRDNPLYLALVPSYLAALSIAATRLARSGRFDAIHAFWPLPHGVGGAVAKRASGVPLVCTFFGVEITWTRSRFPLLKPVLRKIVREADALTAISNYTAGLLREEVPGAEVEIIPFGAAATAREGTPPPFPTPHAPARLLFVGRLVERKGVDVLLEAVAKLPGVRLAVVGDGPARSGLESRASALGLGGQVRFTGFVSQRTLASEYQRADVVVLPARYDAKGDVEGLGVALIEGMAYGRSVIGSDVGGIPDIIRPGETGLLVTPGDPAALAAAISRLDGDREMARKMGAAGREDARARFSWRRITADLEALYRRVISA